MLGVYSFVDPTTGPHDPDTVVPTFVPTFVPTLVIERFQGHAPRS